MRSLFIRFVFALLLVACSNGVETPPTEPFATVQTPDPAEVLAKGVPECPAGNWWDEVDAYPIKAQGYGQRCMTGIFYSRIDPFAPKTPDGCTPHELLTYFYKGGQKIGYIYRGSFGSTIYANEYDSAGRLIMDFNVDSDEIDWLKYQNWTAPPPAAPLDPEGLSQDGAMYKVEVDYPEDGIEPNSDHLFDVAYTVDQLKLAKDTNGLETDPDHRDCRARVDLVVPDGDAWPPDVSALLPEGCDLEVHAQSPSGDHRLVGDYAVDYDGDKRYMGWIEEWFEGGNVVKRSKRVVYSTGQVRMYELEEFAYENGELVSHAHDEGANGTVDWLHTFKHEGLADHRTVSEFHAWPAESKDEPKLYLVREYEGDRLVKIDGYRSHPWSTGDYDAEEPYLDGNFYDYPVWRYEVGYDEAGRKISATVYEDLLIQPKTPSEKRVWTYDSAGRLIYESYETAPYWSWTGDSGLLSHDDFIRHINELRGWVVYFEYDSEGRVFREFHGGPPGEAGRWFEFKYHCE